MGRERLAIRLKMDPMLLSAYGLTPMDVSNAVSAGNVELPSGRIEGDNTELTVRTMGRLLTVEDFNNLVLRRDGDKVVRFRDVGKATVDSENTRELPSSICSTTKGGSAAETETARHVRWMMICAECRARCSVRINGKTKGIHIIS